VSGDDDLIREMREYYQARAPWHDEYMSYSDNASMEELLRPIVATVAELLAGRDVLEVACGTGNWTQVLARRCPRVVATDACEGVLSLARKKEYRGGDVTFLAADAYSLQDVPARFAGAFAADWLSHVPRGQMSRFLEVLHGHLGEGARVVFIDVLRRDHPDLKPYRRDDEGNLFCRRTLPDGTVYDVVKNYPTEGELRCMIEGVGQEADYRQWPGLARWLLTYVVIDSLER